MTKRRAARANGKTADKRRKGASPLNGVVPPPEHRFLPGNPGGPGRPKTLQELKELILNTLAEEVVDENGRRIGLTRAQAMVRTMLIKSPIDRMKLLEYAFGKVTQPVTVEDVTGKNDNELIDELFRLADDIRARAGAGDSG